MGVRHTLLFALLITTSLLLVACPGKLAPTPRQTDSPALTEIAEAVISGASQAISPTGTEARNKPIHIKETEVVRLIRSNLEVMPKAEAAFGGGFCPEFKYSLPATNVYPAPTPTANTSCQQPATTPAAGLAPQIMALAWGPCFLNPPYATWSGGESLTLMTPSTTQMVCGGPSIPQTTFQAGDIVHRWFVSPTSRIFNLYNPNGQPVVDVTSPTYYPVTVLVDTFAGSQLYGATPTVLTCGTSQACLQTLLPSYAFSGWYNGLSSSGETATYSGAAAASIVVDGIHLVGEKAGFIVWNYTVTTADPTNTFAPVPIQIDASGNVLTGAVLYIQDNINLIVTKTTLVGGLTYTNSCGVPVGPVASTLTTNAIVGTYSSAPEILTNWGGGTASCGAGGATLTQAGVSTTTNLIYAF